MPSLHEVLSKIAAREFNNRQVPVSRTESLLPREQAKSTKKVNKKTQTITTEPSAPVKNTRSPGKRHVPKKKVPYQSKPQPIVGQKLTALAIHRQFGGALVETPMADPRKRQAMVNMKQRMESNLTGSKVDTTYNAWGQEYETTAQKGTVKKKPPVNPAGMGQPGIEQTTNTIVKQQTDAPPPKMDTKPGDVSSQPTAKDGKSVKTDVKIDGGSKGNPTFGDGKTKQQVSKLRQALTNRKVWGGAGIGVGLLGLGFGIHEATKPTKSTKTKKAAAPERLDPALAYMAGVSPTDIQRIYRKEMATKAIDDPNFKKDVFLTGLKGVGLGVTGSILYSLMGNGMPYKKFALIGGGLGIAAGLGTYYGQKRHNTEMQEYRTMSPKEQVSFSTKKLDKAIGRAMT